ncbi:MAG: hypothetical protein LBD09_06410 [Treponema sp.]|jgi:hypothetical protein|nr:hypothetical protein [Treponema sp.]
MRKYPVPACLAALVLNLTLSPDLSALDLSFTAGLGNRSFDTAAETPLGAGPFKGRFFPLGMIRLSDRVSDTISFSASVERDPLLRTTALCEMEVSARYFSLSVGPLFGLFNTRENPLKPGISAGMALELPGILFARLSGGTTFGEVRDKGDYTLERGRAAFGFWLPNLISTLSVTRDQYSARLTETLHTRDERLRFCYRAEVHAKNVPYTIAIEAGYQTLSRHYDDAAAGKAADQYREIFLGVEAAFTVRPLLTILAGVETPLYHWGKPPLEKDSGAVLFRAFTGFRWTLDKV